MKISLNNIRYYNMLYDSAPDPAVEGVDKLVDKIGAQLGAVEAIMNLSERYEGIKVAKVVSCEKIEGSDHLSLCKIDDGSKAQNVERDEQGHVQVVCGAPNCREGLMVAWIPPGVTVPATVNKDPFVLEVREIRGHKSNGMLASPNELAISDNHTGILEIDEEAKPGDDFAKLYGLDDIIIDIENKMFTHRPDLFGQLGVARELAGIQGQAFKSPHWYTNPQAPDNGQSDAIKSYSVTNEIPDLCPRYMLLAMDNVKIMPSPMWLQSLLTRVGIRPINNVVDVTNYMMVLTAQPLHAFDFDKVAKNGDAQIVVRKPHDGENINLLDGKEITPHADAILICDQDKPIALGGVMGGNNSEIDERTTRILIECANFDMYSIRRTAMEHGLFTDAVTRFTKGQSPLQCPAVLYKAARLVQEVCPAAKPVGEIVDAFKNPVEPQSVNVNSNFVNERLGEKLSTEEMANLLRNVEFDVQVDGDELTVKAPFWRTDIDIPEDIVEETGRLHGYDKLPLELPKRDLAPAPHDAMLELKTKVRDLLSAAGANEVLTYSFVHGNLLDKVGQSHDQAFQLVNALSPDLQYYRLSLTPSLLEKIHPNIKAGYDEFAIFEIGKGHNLQHKDDDNGLPMEFEMLDLVYAANDKQANAGAPFYQARKYVNELARHFGIELDFCPFEAEENYAVAKPYEHTRSAKIFVKGTDLPLGMVGEYKASVKRSLKLPRYCAGFGIGLTQLLQAAQQAQPGYTALPRFPKVEQDMSLKVPAELSYGELANFIQQSLGDKKPGQTHFTLVPLDIYQSDDDKAHKHVTFRLSIASYEKTMRDVEINNLLDQVAAAAKNKFGAERI